MKDSAGGDDNDPTAEVPDHQCWAAAGFGVQASCTLSSPSGDGNSETWFWLPTFNGWPGREGLASCKA